ncbi:hypothetical protein LTR78_005280 [Recurvomyces mirabilis]|uniref:Cytochrome b5 heme-binding domain-containing protein n=1 Tax=Recurvomyces mirabilis TaxID=574656 RepID=A0AAE1C1N9_9PEZI|nr:hypothetical protein LTR78_005280 [Recurvomyces mirabilis]KAK5157830.1 hypothetical protein LTS14_003752 [Recurvomyces mirabilis]
MSWNLFSSWLQPSSLDTKPDSGTDGQPNGHAPAVTITNPDKENEKTPKAEVSKTTEGVPTFSLSDGDNTTSSPETETPSFPALNSAQRAKPSNSPNRMAPPPAPTLMPPPARPATINRGLGPPPSTASSLRLPSTGPLPNRGPPAGSQQRVSSLSPNGTAVSVPNPRGKVLLSPGHSPMDWAALTKSSSADLTGVKGFQRVTPSQLKKMTGRKGKPAWSSWQGKVYNITPYLPFHPGGEAELMKAAGRDGAKLFMDVHPWVNWENMLGACLVGVLVPEEESPLEGLD